MSEKTKFHNMTKPMKFRSLKQAKMMIVLWCKGIRERIIYSFNYILYKLYILERYSYRDSVEQVVPMPFNFKTQSVVEAENFKGTVVMSLICESHFDIDYFYRQKKDGSKKITLSLKNEEEHRLYFESHLEDICLKVSDRWYEPNNLPIFKVAMLDIPPVAFDHNAPLKPAEYETVTYDLLPLKSLKCQSLLGKLEVSDLTWSMMTYYYEIACNGFMKKLNSMNLHDLIRD